MYVCRDSSALKFPTGVGWWVVQEAKVFIAKCLGPEELRPSVPQLLEDRFLRKVLRRQH